MLTKVLFFAVICCVAIISNAAPNAEPEADRGKTMKNQAEIQLRKVNEKAREIYNKVKNILQRFWDRVTGRESKRKQQEIDELKAKLAQVQREMNDALIAEKRKWQAKLAAQQAELDRLEGDKEALAKAKEKLKQLQVQAAEAISGVVDSWDKEVNNLGGQVEQALAE